jgi:hypothetical protein
VLAVLSTIQLNDWTRVSLPFPISSDVRTLEAFFDQELTLLEGKGADEEWFAADEKIESFALTLRYSSQAKSAGLFLLHIDGEMARFKAVFD